MDLAGLLLFSSALFIAAASPGPGIAAIVARVLGRGPNEAALFSLGVALGDVVWLTFAILGLAALAPIAWGSGYYVTETFLPPDRPLFGAMVRALPFGLLLLALRPGLPHGIWWWRSLVLGILNVGAFFVLIFVAAYRLPGGLAATLTATAPVMRAAVQAGITRSSKSTIMATSVRLPASSRPAPIATAVSSAFRRWAFRSSSAEASSALRFMPPQMRGPPSTRAVPSRAGSVTQSAIPRAPRARCPPERSWPMVSQSPVSQTK